MALRRIVAPSLARTASAGSVQALKGAPALCRRQLASLATPDEIAAALAKGGTLVDLRTKEEFSETPPLQGALHAEWDRENETLADVPLPNGPLILYCRSGGRAEKAKAVLEARGYQGVLNAGGPTKPELWEALEEGSRKK
eukprot:6210348-Pleurochrysis_carterae.AAC.1